MATCGMTTRNGSRCTHRVSTDTMRCAAGHPVSVQAAVVDAAGGPDAVAGVSARPWESEPDHESWRDERTGLECEVVRQSHGALCGYVTVPEGHPAYLLEPMDSQFDGIDVHGGITYAAPDRASGHRVGFDCAHTSDFAPDRDGAFAEPGDVANYCDFEYVREETTRLANQLYRMI